MGNTQDSKAASSEPENTSIKVETVKKPSNSGKAVNLADFDSPSESKISHIPSKTAKRG